MTNISLLICWFIFIYLNFIYITYVYIIHICLIHSRHHISCSSLIILSTFFIWSGKHILIKKEPSELYFLIVSIICYNPTRSEKGHEGWKSDNVNVGLTSSDQYFSFHSFPSYYQYDFLNQHGKETLTAKETATMLAALLSGPAGQLPSSRWNTRHSRSSLDPCSQGSISLVQGGIQGRYFRILSVLWRVPEFCPILSFHNFTLNINSCKNDRRKSPLTCPKDGCKVRPVAFCSIYLASVPWNCRSSGRLTFLSGM